MQIIDDEKTVDVIGMLMKQNAEANESEINARLEARKLREQRDDLIAACEAMVKASQNDNRGLAEARLLADAAIAKAKAK